MTNSLIMHVQTLETTRIEPIIIFQGNSRFSTFSRKISHYISRWFRYIFSSESYLNPDPRSVQFLWAQRHMQGSRAVIPLWCRGRCLWRWSGGWWSPPVCSPPPEGGWETPAGPASQPPTRFLQHLEEKKHQIRLTEPAENPQSIKSVAREEKSEGSLPQPRMPRPLIMVVCESVPTTLSG